MDVLTDLLDGSASMLRLGRHAVAAADLEVAARGYAAGLAARGHAPGDGVVVDVGDDATALAVAFGGWWAGLRVAFAPPAPGPPAPDALAGVAARAGARLAVTDRTGADGAPPPTQPDLAVTTPRALAEAPARWRPLATAGDVALEMFTSGSTGTPKCVAFSHRAMVGSVEALLARLRLAPGERIWTPAQVTLPGTLANAVLPGLAASADVTVATTSRPERLAQGWSEAAPTVTYAVPYVYGLLAQRRVLRALRDLPAPRWCLSSSSSLRREVFDTLHDELGVAVRNAYCSSEAGAVTFNDGEDLDALRTTAGRPLPGVEVTFAPRDGDGAGDGDGDGGAPSGVGRRAGEVVVGGPLVAEGYRRPDGGLTPFHGRVRTGDAGRLDDAGNLVVDGRLDGRVNVGAHVVDPAAVEDRIRQHPAVEDCVVVPRAHPRLGDVPVARVVPRPGARPSERELIEHCRVALAAPSVPRAVLWADALPRTATGKAIRRRAS